MLRELTAMTVLLISSTIATADHPLPFTVKVLTVDANEGCDVADVDNDGKLDVIAGRNWFRNGEWVARPVRPSRTGKPTGKHSTRRR